MKALISSWEGIDSRPLHLLNTIMTGMIVTIRMNGKKIKLLAHTSTHISSFISYQSLHSLLSASLDSMVEEVFLITAPKIDAEENMKLTKLLEEYSDLFKEPQGLPLVFPSTSTHTWFPMIRKMRLRGLYRNFGRMG